MAGNYLHVLLGAPRTLPVSALPVLLRGSWSEQRQTLKVKLREEQPKFTLKCECHLVSTPNVLNAPGYAKLGEWSR